MNSIQSHITSDLKLPSPPGIAVRILEAINKDESSYDELGRIIANDPALSMRILQAANSPFYALPSKADSIERAMAVLGVNALKNIALSFVIAKELRVKSAGTFSFDFFWKRSVTAAVSAELIASLINRKSDETFVTALLQDIGIVVMYLCKPDDYLKVIEEKKTSGDPIVTVENNIFGFNHQESGMEVLKAWGLPPTIYQPIGHHHFDQTKAADVPDQEMILMLSDKISAVYHGNHSAEKINEIKELLATRYPVDETQIEATIDAVAERSVQAMSLFEIDPGKMKPFSLMLQEANEELGKLNLSYEYLVIELKQAKETAEKLAGELKAANSKLRELAFRDGLTGLFNHRYFQDFIEKELNRATRYKRAFSLIMLDIDHFKKINDVYGHPVGDTVLKEISSAIEQTVRNCDVVSRYGGEEFAVVLPETALKGAVILAERLRKKVEQLVIKASDENVQMTVSLGLTVWEPGLDVTHKAEIIDAADRALYKSKKTGRNKVSFVPSAMLQ
jgi:diguanylate cyclase (GGDEF)-like protein